MQAFQSVQELHLRPIDLFPGLRQREKLALIYFRKILLQSGMGRPFQSEKIAFHGAQLGSSPKSPCQDSLPGFLPYLAKVNKRCGRRDRSLFFEFAFCSFKVVLTRIYKSLWNRPCPFVFPSPERTAGMDEKNLENRPGILIHQQPGTHLRHGANFITVKIEPQSKAKNEHQI